MKKIINKILILLTLWGFLFVSFEKKVNPQESVELELTAQEILGRVDDVLKYPDGLLKGKVMHILPTGKKYSINIEGSITGENFLFVMGDSNRGDQLKVLYNLGGEDIWVYNILSLKLFHKIDVDRYDPILNTNFNFSDLSNADLQSNYTAKIVGETIVKQKRVYFLKLKPLFKRGNYGGLRLYVTKEGYIPLRIDFLDRDGVVFKKQTIAQTATYGNRTFPIRYDMFHLKRGTLSILKFFNVDRKIKFDKRIFRHQSLGEIK